MKSVRLLCYCICGPDDAQRSIASLSFWYYRSLWTSSLGRSGGGVGKGRRACNYLLVSGICLSASKKLMSNADWMTLVTTSLPLASGFQCLFTFALIFTSRSFSLRADWRKSDSSVDGEPQGNWRWNSNSRDIVASSPSFSCPTARVPRRACSQANFIDQLKCHFSSFSHNLLFATFHNQSPRSTNYGTTSNPWLKY